MTEEEKMKAKVDALANYRAATAAARASVAKAEKQRTMADAAVAKAWEDFYKVNGDAWQSFLDRSREIEAS